MPFPFVDIAKSVLENAPQVILNPALGLRFVFYWAMVFVVYAQYRKTARMQGRLYGQSRANPVRLTLVAIAEGLGVGLIGSYLMTFFGVSFLPDGGGLIWVLAVAVGLMVINARLMCFSYAGGIVSLVYLIFGAPKVSVPALMGLVAILHLMESLLILTNGSAGATPVYLERGGRQVGAFYLQRSWPVPVALLILAVVSPLQTGGGIEMPDWWPLLRTSPEILAHPGAVFFLHALPAALGYGDMALTCPPRVKARRTATSLAAYSVILLGLAVASTHWTPLVWLTALFAPLGHEGIVRIGTRRELAGRPYFVPPASGVMVLDIVPGTPAKRLGLGPGWVITEINGRPLTGRERLEEELRAAGEARRLTMEVLSPPSWLGRGGLSDGAVGRSDRCPRRRPEVRRLTLPFEAGAVFGIIPVPEPGDDMGLVVTTASPLAALVRRLTGRRSGRR